MKALGGNKRERKLRVATFSECKQKEVEELLAKNNIDVVTGQESWEREDTRIGKRSLPFVMRLLRK